MKLLKQSTGTGDSSGQLLVAENSADDGTLNLIDLSDQSLSVPNRNFINPKRFRSQLGENDISGDKSGSENIRDQTISDGLPPEFRSVEKLPKFERGDNTVDHGANAFTPANDLQHMTPQPVSGNYIQDAMNRMINNQNSADWRQDSQEAEVRKALLEKRGQAELPGNKYTSSECSAVTSSVD